VLAPRILGVLPVDTEGLNHGSKARVKGSADPLAEAAHLREVLTISA
jgi:hypothetical protein